MKIFIVGVAGRTGGLLADKLLKDGDQVAGLARRSDQICVLARAGVDATLGDLASMSERDLAEALKGSDAVVFSAGAGGSDGDRATVEIDGEGPGKVASAAASVGIRRFYLVSVFPEAWRGHGAPAEFEDYIRQKKAADVDIAARDLDWVIVRPGSLTDDGGVGTVDLGFAKIHGEIAREDVAATIAALIHDQSVNRVILELTGGATTIDNAVAWVSNSLREA